MSDHKPKPPDMDLIRMVQQARMLHDREAVPSQMTGVYWIESKPLKEGAPPTPRAGEWVIVTTLAAVDGLWATIREATEQGQLGYKSKVATVALKGKGDATQRTIVVRTRDADDEADVKRVETLLRSFGISEMTYRRIGDAEK